MITLGTFITAFIVTSAMAAVCTSLARDDPLARKARQSASFFLFTIIGIAALAVVVRLLEWAFIRS